MAGFWTPGPRAFEREDQWPAALVDAYRLWLPLEWSLFDNDPICILLNHSDCEGEIAVEDLKKLAPRLLELAEKITRVAHEQWTIDYVKNRMRQFAKGCQEAIEANEPLKFH